MRNLAHWLHNLLHEPLDEIQRDNDVTMISLHPKLIQLLKLQIQIIGRLPHRHQSSPHIACSTGRQILLCRQLLECLIHIQQFPLLFGQCFAQQVGICLLGLLMVYAFYNDIMRFFKSGS